MPVYDFGLSLKIKLQAIFMVGIMILVVFVVAAAYIASIL